MLGPNCKTSCLVRAAIGEERGDGARKRKHSPIPLFKPRERQATKHTKEKDAKGAAAQKPPAERADAVEPSVKRPAPADSQARTPVVLTVCAWRMRAVASARLLHSMRTGLSCAAPASPCDVDRWRAPAPSRMIFGGLVNLPSFEEQMKRQHDAAELHPTSVALR